MKILCPVCHNEPAIIDPYYGVLPGQKCLDKQAKLQKPGSLPEFTSESIKQQRKEHAEDILPIHRKGELSKEWVQKWGAKKAKQRGFTDKEIRGAKNVWGKSDLKYYG